MDKVYIYADFDFLEKEELIGTLFHERVRGSDVYSFEFSETWLKSFANINLSPDLQNIKGKQYSQPNEIFSCFADTLPDRWGRNLFRRKEEIEAIKENRIPRKLFDWDYFVNINDFLRIGGIRIKENISGEFLNTQKNSISVPPISNINELLLASQNEEKQQNKNLTAEEKWINQLLFPCTSLGGARPKAGVIDEKGCLYIAKFPSINDNYDVAKWEHLACLLGREVGIETAETELLDLNNKYMTLLSKRFDRNNGKRIHFASAMTLLGLKDGNNARDGYGYIDIADFIISNSENAQKDLEDLYRRVAYNICIGNTDDHFRNHGFLLTKRGWKLAPAYDINPTSYFTQSLLINSKTEKSDIKELLMSHEEYLIPKNRAEKIISEVVDGIRKWKDIARKIKITESEKTIFSKRIEYFITEKEKIDLSKNLYVVKPKKKGFGI